MTTTTELLEKYNQLTQENKAKFLEELKQLEYEQSLEFFLNLLEETTNDERN